MTVSQNDRSLPPSGSVLAAWTSTSSETHRRSSRQSSNDRARHECGVGADEGPRQCGGDGVARSPGRGHAYLTATSLSALLAGIERLPPGRRKSGLDAALAGLVAELFGSRILPFDQQ